MSLLYGIIHHFSIVFYQIFCIFIKKSAKRPPIGEERTSPTEESSNQATAWFCVGNITEVSQCVVAERRGGATRADGAWS